MPVSAFTAGYIADDFIRANDLQPTCKQDIVLLATQLGEDDEANKLLLGEWLEAREHVRKSPAAKADEMVDITLERKAFGPAASPSGRASLYRKYGTELAEQRREAWGASPGTIQSGTEPGAENHSAEVVKKAAKIVADQDSNSPFNPNKRYLNETTRANECAKFFVRYGTKAAQAHCAKFGTDIAGRVLRKRT
jgi:hypothetical protein